MNMLTNETRHEVRDMAGSYVPAEAGSEAVLAGYKRTELGLLPDDWQIQELGDWKPFITSGSRGWADYYSDRGSAFIRITNMSRESIYLDLDDLKLVNLPPDSTEGTRTQLQDGDLLVSITADIGIIAFVDSSVPKPAYINQHIALVRLDPVKVDSRFLSYFLAGESSQKAFRAGTDRGAKAGMNLRGVREIKAAVPLLAEQRAIAAALSDVDAMLAKLDQLIAKKRDLKRAAMQQLLEGRVRLPGYSHKWARRSFSDLATPRKTRVDPSQSGTQAFCIELEHIEPAAGRLNGFTSTTPGASIKTIFESGDVLFGKLRSYLRKYWLANRSGVCSTEIWVLAPNLNNVTSEYLAQIVQLDAFIKAASVAYGTHMPRSEWSVVSAFELDIPPLPEQAAIATILSDMDAEIAALEARRAKTQELKQGMMQALLTGRIRLL